MDDLIRLWSTKAQLAEEHPFEISVDVFNAVLDAIMAVVFGPDIEGAAILGQIRHLQESAKPSVPSNPDMPVIFAPVDRPESYRGLVNVSDSLELPVKSPFPQLTHWFVRQLPSYRRANRAKEALILGELDKGIARIRNGDTTEKCALHNVLQRESATAQKEDREPHFKSRMIVDEVGLPSPALNSY